MMRKLNKRFVNFGEILDSIPLRLQLFKVNFCMVIHCNRCRVRLPFTSTYKAHKEDVDKHCQESASEIQLKFN